MDSSVHGFIFTRQTRNSPNDYISERKVDVVGIK